MIKDLLERSKSYLNTFFETLDEAQFELVLDLCLKTKGIIFFTGLGKSGFVAKKAAMTLVSFGTKSMFLDPLNCLHGDLGIVDRGDVVIMLSKSGHTEELIQLVPFLKKRGASIVACVSTQGSPLEDKADICVNLPVVCELDLNNLVPTTSAQVQLIFADVLCMALMASQGCDLELYSTLHPGGSIGKKLLVTVGDLMLQEAQVPLCFPETPIRDVLVELTSKKCGCVIVSNERKNLCGIFTDGDLRRSLENLGTAALEMSVGKLMSHSPAFVDKTTTAFEAKKAMQQEGKQWVNVLPITENDQVVGLIRLHDILKAGI